jgi:PAS domain S-box-containing protein
MKGYGSVEVIGRHFALFYSEEDRESDLPNRLLAHALREGRAEAEGWRVRKDGSRFWASAIIVPLRDQVGRLRGFGKLTRDESDRRAAEVFQERAVIVTEQERIAAMLAGSVVRRLFSIGLSLDAARQLASSAPELSKAIEAAASQLDDAVKYLRGAVFNISQAHEVGEAGDDPEMWLR